MNISKKIPIFVINMEKDKQRRDYISNKLDQLGLSFEFVKAVDGSLIEEADIARKTLKNKTINSIGREMSRGEIGCVLSHLYIYKKMIKEGIEHALIFEDDVDIDCDNFYEVIASLVKDTDNRPQVYLLTEVISYLSKNMKKINSKYDVASIVQALSTAGYLINLPAAKKMFDINKKVWIVADDWVRYRMYSKINIYCILPSIVKGDPIFSTHSNITSERKKKKKIRTIRYVISRNKNKIIADIKKYFWFIPFQGYTKVK